MSIAAVASIKCNDCPRTESSQWHKIPGSDTNAMRCSACYDRARTIGRLERKRKPTESHSQDLSQNKKTADAISVPKRARKENVALPTSEVDLSAFAESLGGVEGASAAVPSIGSAQASHPSWPQIIPSPQMPLPAPFYGFYNPVVIPRAFPAQTNSLTLMQLTCLLQMIRSNKPGGGAPAP